MTLPEATIPIRLFDPDGVGLSIDQTGCELLGLGGEGLARFRAVDAFHADLGFYAVPEDLNSVAVRDSDNLAGEGLGGEGSWR